MGSRFLFNDALWAELASSLGKSKSVCAAVAYLGSGANEILPLKKGDKLVVDMSLRAVRAGSTDPKEVKKYLQKGVVVFSRGSLHAKFFVLGKNVISGSANISMNARNSLDEAAILSDDPAVLRRALATFQGLCTEPVRKDYLAKCIKEYRPPKLQSKNAKTGDKHKRIVHAKLWIVGGLGYNEIPEDEEKEAERAEKSVKHNLFAYEQSQVSYSHYATPQAYFENLREGDWLITCIRSGKVYDVYPPARFLGLREYPRAKGGRRYLVLYEEPTGQKQTTWTKLRRALIKSSGINLNVKPRTRPVADEEEADALLRLWDSRGRFRGL